MHSLIQLLSLDFDGTLVSRTGEPVLDAQCMEMIRELQDAGATWEPYSRKLLILWIKKRRHALFTNRTDRLA